MRFSISRGGAVGLLALATSLASCSSAEPFSPPQVFKNVNLLRTVDLIKPYVKETIAAIVENVSKEPQSEYYVPFPKDVVPKISSVEAIDKKGSLGDFKTELMEADPESSTQYYRITFSVPLAPSESYTISITSIITSTLTPIPASITQVDRQYLQWTGPKYVPSPYSTEKQKTRLRFPSSEIEEFSKFSNLPSGETDPSKTANSLIYGPYGTPNTTESSPLISVRYEYTAPVIRVSKLERDIEVSHWGGNLAIEERYWLANVGAKLKDNFSRVTWTSRSYYNAPSAAINMLSYPLQVGAADVYFTDEIGNVTTSRFRSNSREAHLELKPRYPLFGGWNYSFVVGWNHDLKDYLKAKVAGGEIYILKVPFMQGPTDFITYENFQLRIILPEGATNVAYHSPYPVTEHRYTHQTYMDTTGRPALHLTTKNLIDEHRGKDIIVTYTYPASAAFRKPLTVTAGVMTIFTLSWLLSRVDVRIGNN